MLFAGARQAAGAPSVSVELREHATVSDLKRALSVAHPALEPYLARVRIAIEGEYVDERQTVSSTSEIALIPPVSGGSIGDGERAANT